MTEITIRLPFNTEFDDERQKHTSFTLEQFIAYLDESQSDIEACVSNNKFDKQYADEIEALILIQAKLALSPYITESITAPSTSISSLLTTLRTFKPIAESELPTTEKISIVSRILKTYSASFKMGVNGRLECYDFSIVIPNEHHEDFVLSITRALSKHGVTNKDFIIVDNSDPSSIVIITGPLKEIGEPEAIEVDTLIKKGDPSSRTDNSDPTAKYMARMARRAAGVGTAPIDALAIAPRSETSSVTASEGATPQAADGGPGAGGPGTASAAAIEDQLSNDPAISS